MLEERLLELLPDETRVLVERMLMRQPVVGLVLSELEKVIQDKKDLLEECATHPRYARIADFVQQLTAGQAKKFSGIQLDSADDLMVLFILLLAYIADGT